MIDITDESASRREFLKKTGIILTSVTLISPAVPTTLKEAPKRKELADSLHIFIRMYRPHAAREDTILFPALRTIVSEKEFYDLGEEFEEKEEKLFGEGGFEKIVAQVRNWKNPLASMNWPNLRHPNENPESPCEPKMLFG
jgi:hypothetical protein